MVDGQPAAGIENMGETLTVDFEKVAIIARRRQGRLGERHDPLYLTNARHRCFDGDSPRLTLSVEAARLHLTPNLDHVVRQPETVQFTGHPVNGIAFGDGRDIETLPGWRELAASFSRSMVRQVPDEVFGIKKYDCTVVSNRNVASFIKELVLKLPEGEEMDFKAGGYIQIECPPHQLFYKDFDIDEQFHDEWDRYKLWRYESHVKESVSRAYSMANFPLEKGLIMLNVRIASPPPRMPDVPLELVAEKVSSSRPETSLGSRIRSR